MKCSVSVVAFLYCMVLCVADQEACHIKQSTETNKHYVELRNSITNISVDIHTKRIVLRLSKKEIVQQHDINITFTKDYVSVGSNISESRRANRSVYVDGHIRVRIALDNQTLRIGHNNNFSFLLFNLHENNKHPQYLWFERENELIVERCLLEYIKASDSTSSSGTDTNPHWPINGPWYTGSNSNPDSTTVSDSGSNSNQETTTNSGSNSNRNLDSTTKSGSDSNRNPDSGTNSGSDSNSNPDSGTNSGSASNSNPDSNTNSGSISNPDSTTNSGSGSNGNPDSNTNSGSGSNSNPDSTTNSGSSNNSNPSGSRSDYPGREITSEEVPLNCSCIETACTCPSYEAGCALVTCDCTSKNGESFTFFNCDCVPGECSSVVNTYEDSTESVDYSTEEGTRGNTNQHFDNGDGRFTKAPRSDGDGEDRKTTNENSGTWNERTYGYSDQNGGNPNGYQGSENAEEENGGTVNGVNGFSNVGAVNGDNISTSTTESDGNIETETITAKFPRLSPMVILLMALTAVAVLVSVIGGCCCLAGIIMPTNRIVPEQISPLKT